MWYINSMYVYLPHYFEKITNNIGKYDAGFRIFAPKEMQLTINQAP